MAARMSVAALILPLLAIAGCAPVLGELLVSTPNRFNPFVQTGRLAPPARQALGVGQQFRVIVDSPGVELAVSVVEPDHPATPRGTVLVLHGIRARSFWMLGTAHMLADAGYRAVLVDLRGHGRSTGDFLTFGPDEARDLSDVIDELERRELIAGRLGVYGISYGATTSIHLASIDSRVAAVVAVAPFSTMRDVVPDYAGTAMPVVEQFLSSETIGHTIDAAGRSGEFDPDDSDAIRAISRTNVPVLIVHGTDDWLVPPYHALRLYEAGGRDTELVFVPRTGHVKIWFDPGGDVARHARTWFDQHLGS